MDGSVATGVRVVNAISEREHTEAAMSKADLMIAYGTVGTAMMEAIRIAVAAECYSFVSKNRSRDQYAFGMSDFQSYAVSKSKGGPLRGELIRVLHYYSLIVPAFQALVRNHVEKNEDKPLQLKFLAGTPLSERQGINALMPVEVNPQAENQPDVTMNQAPDDDVQVEEVEEFPGPKPAPPLPYEPIIEDSKEDDQMDTSGVGKPERGYVEAAVHGDR